MVFRSKKILIFAVLASAAAFMTFLVSCKGPGSSVVDGPPEEGYNVCITYAGNGGLYDSKYESKKVYVKDGSYLPLPPQGSLDAPLNKGYYIDCWKIATYDEENEKLSLTDEVVDFSKYKAHTDVVIAPVWSKGYTVCFYDSDDAATAKKTMEYVITPSSAPVNMPTNPPSKADHTFFGCYEFSGKDVTEGDKLAAFPITFESVSQFDADNDGVVSLYPRFLQNENGRSWKLVSSAKDFSSGTNYYLLNDIDMTGVDLAKWTRAFGANGCIIEGNGHSISGIRFDESYQKGQTSYGLFAENKIGSIRNLTFENCSYTVDLENMLSDTGARIAFISGSGTALTLNSVSFNQCSLRVVGKNSPFVFALYGGEDLVLDGESVSDPQNYTLDGIEISK